MKGYITYDTSVIISRGQSDLPDNFLWSSVVQVELSASAKDESQRKQLDLLFNAYAKDNSLIYPKVEDWQLAGKILFWLTQKRRKSDGGKLVKLKPGMSQRMAMDVLLAVSARRWDATIVVDNWEDFKAIQHYCKGLKIKKASESFRK
jgi:predicted nucleic acid-binding protein